MKENVGVGGTSDKDLQNQAENAAEFTKEEKKVLDLIAEGIVEFVLKEKQNGSTEQ